MLLIALVLAVVVVEIFTAAICYGPGGDTPSWVIPKICSVSLERKDG